MTTRTELAEKMLGVWPKTFRPSTERMLAALDVLEEECGQLEILAAAKEYADAMADVSKFYDEWKPGPEGKESREAYNAACDKAKQLLIVYKTLCAL